MLKAIKSSGIAVVLATAMLSAPVHAAPFDIAGPAASGIDSSTNPVDVNLIAGISGLITDLNIEFSVARTGTIHPEDWTVTLIHGSTQVVLSFAGRVHDVAASTWTVTFDDEASAGLGTSGFPDGTYIPDEPLSAFDGEELAGTWTLRFEDDSIPNEDDELVSWRIFGEVAQAVPEPFSLALLGAGLVAAGVLRRRRRPA